MTDLEIGSVLAGHRIEGRAGKGGMGVVYRATDLRLDRLVALKVVAPEFAADPAFAERFKRESRLAASIDHPNVIPIHGAGEDDGRLFVTMRFVDGTDLAEVLRRDGRLAPGRAVAIAGQVAAALDAAHASGLVHRDVKPANILMQGEHVFLTDFGLSKHASSESDLTETGAMLGTVDYMAPEQIKGGIVDARSDVYALGCVLYQALAGRVPFEKTNPMAKLFAHASEEPPPLRDVPPALADVVLRAMEKEPGRRFQSAGELAQAAADAVGVSLVTAAPLPSRPRRAATGRRRRSLVIGLVGMFAVAVAAALALIMSGGDEERDETPAITAVVRRVNAGITESVCRNDMTSRARDRYFAPRSGKAALNACLNLSGGDPERKPLVVEKTTVQGDTASVRIDLDGDPSTFYLVKDGGRWRIDDFTETADARYTRRVSAVIQPSFRITPAIEQFVFGELPYQRADGVPAQAVGFLEDAVEQIERLQPPRHVTDIHGRIVGAMRDQLSGARDALAAQERDDPSAYRTAEKRVFASLEVLGAALDDLNRAQ